MKRYIVRASSNSRPIGGGYDKYYRRATDKEVIDATGCTQDELDLQDALSAYGGMKHVGWAMPKPQYVDYLDYPYDVAPILDDNGTIILGEIAGGRVYEISVSDIAAQIG